MPALEDILGKKLLNLEDAKLLRKIKITKETGVISFSDNDYLGLSQDKRVVAASIKAIKKYGVGAGASRLVTGNHPLYDELESLLTKTKKVDASCVFGSGYLANIGTIPALVGRGDLVVVDRLSHSCIHMGAKLSGSSYKIYLHNSLDNLDNILKKNRNKYINCLIITETIFSMDGDKSPLKEIMNIADKYDSWVMSDDAHGFGTVKSHKTHVQMGTLSKAVGSYGGYVCGSKVLIDYIKTSARSLIYSTALPPGVIGASIETIKIINKDKKLCSKPLKKARLFTSMLGLEAAQSAIVPLIVGSEENALRASKELKEEGFLVIPIRPPTVPKGTSRLRFTFSAIHKDEDIIKMAEFIKKKGWNNV